MDLLDALAVWIRFKDLGYPNKRQRAMLDLAETTISEHAHKVMARFYSEAPGERGHSAGAVEIDGNPITGSAAAPSILAR